MLEGEGFDLASKSALNEKILITAAAAYDYADNAPDFESMRWVSTA